MSNVVCTKLVNDGSTIIFSIKFDDFNLSELGCKKCIDIIWKNSKLRLNYFRIRELNSGLTTSESLFLFFVLNFVVRIGLDFFILLIHVKV